MLISKAHKLFVTKRKNVRGMHKEMHKTITSTVSRWENKKKKKRKAFLYTEKIKFSLFAVGGNIKRAWEISIKI